MNLSKSDALVFDKGRYLLSDPDELRKRLEPLLGDLEGYLGADSQWHWALAQIFSSEDLRVAALVGSGMPEQCFEVQAFAVNDAERFDLEPRYATSFVIAVASVVEECRRLSVLPTSVTIDRASEELALWLGSQKLFHVSKMVFRSVEQELRERAVSTVVGVRESDDPLQELLDRMRRWPGLSGLDLSSMHSKRQGSPNAPAFPAAEHVHHAVPQEWLLSAHALCARCGHPKPSRNLVEAVAAAVFEFPSWSHLVSRWSEDDRNWVCRPWAIVAQGATSSDSTVVGFYASGFDAVAELLWRLPKELAEDLQEIEFAWGSACAMPAYGLRLRPRDYGNEEGLHRAYAWASALNEVSLADSGIVEAVGAALAMPGHAEIEALFAIDQMDAQRFEALEQWAGEQLLVAEGRWRFTLSNDGTLRVRRFGGNGGVVCLEEAAVQANKAQLWTWRHHQVLCADDGGSSPQMILDGLSETTLRVLTQFFPQQARWTHVWGAWPSYRKAGADPFEHPGFAYLVQRLEQRSSGSA